MARPAEFDRREVLDKAMEVFWRTGFTATSVADLVTATSLKPGSLYSAFDSKRGLFVEVIDTYAARRIESAQTALENAENPLTAIHDFFGNLRQDVCEDEIGRGCLMVNTMLELATEDDDLRERITDYLNQVEKYLCTALTRAKEMGLLESHANPKALAAFLVNNIWGLRVMSSTRPDHQRYQQVIDQILASLPIKASVQKAS